MRILRVPAVLASATLAATLLSAQGTGTKPSAPTGSVPTGSAPGTNAPGTNPSTTGFPNRGTIPNNTTNPTMGPDAITRGTFFYGKVAMSDGTALPTNVVIERVCGSSARPQAYVDPKGNFSFQVGNTSEMIGDATVSRPSSIGMGSQSSTTPINLSNCDLRASLPGFRSDNVSLAGRRSMDEPNVGTIFLHRLANVEGLTTSATSALAPKEAHKAFDKGVDARKKSKIDEAQADFLKAAELYPRYASAWYELGRVYEQRNHIAEARDAYAKSIAADSKFVNPYERLYMLSIDEKKWDDVATTTDRIMRLNPYDYPDAVYFNAVANLQLGKLDVAEKSAREALTMDSGTKNPKVHYVLAVILIQKKDYKAAADSLRTYLKSDSITDRDRVNKMLADLEKQVEAKADLKPEP